MIHITYTEISVTHQIVTSEFNTQPKRDPFVQLLFCKLSFNDTLDQFESIFDLYLNTVQLRVDLIKSIKHLIKQGVNVFVVMAT